MLNKCLYIEAEHQRTKKLEQMESHSFDTINFLIFEGFISRVSFSIFFVFFVTIGSFQLLNRLIIGDHFCKYW